MARALKGRPYMTRAKLGKCPACGKKGLGAWRTVALPRGGVVLRECRYCCETVEPSWANPSTATKASGGTL